MKRRIKGYIFLFIIFTQFILLGFNVVGINPININEIKETKEKISLNSGSSHSSSYYFPVNKSSPLITEEFNDKDLENNPKIANNYYYNNDFALTLNLDKYVLTLGEILSINFGLTCNLTASGGKTITVEIYQEFYRDYSFFYPNYYETKTPIYTEDLVTDSNGQVSTIFTLTSTKGIYTVYAYAEGCRTYKEFTVGEVGIFYKGPRYYKANQDYIAALHIINLTGFTVIPNANYNYSISYYDYSSTEWFVLTTDQGQTDEKGYSTFNTNIPLEVDDYHLLRLTICTIDGKAKFQTFLYESWDYYYYCIWGGEQNTNQERFQYVVTTDKTIYSPGDMIYIRVLVLEYSFMNETKNAMDNTPIFLTIYNPDEFAVFWTTITTDDYGILSYTFPLDKDCELGYYGFEFSQAGIKYRYNVKVDYYIKPVFRVEIDTNGKDFYPNDEKFFEGFVYVSYYFGQPVVGASVNLTIRSYWGEIRYSIKGFTNGEGRFYFKIYLNSIKDLEYSFSVDVNVVDNYGRSGSIKKIYTRNEELFAYGYLTNWAPHPTDILEYYFYVYQYVMLEDLYSYGYWYWAYNPLANVSVEIEIYGIKDYPIYSSEITFRTLLASYSKFTNIYGAGQLEFTLPIEQIKLYDLFEIRLSVNLEDGRSTESSYYFRYKKYSLDINIVDASLDLGQTLEFDVTFKDILKDSPCTGEGKIYIYDSNYQLIGRVSDIISGTKTYYFPIPNFYPEGKYYIYSYIYSRSNDYFGGLNYHSAHESFKVGDFQIISFETNFTNTGIFYDEITVQIDDTIEINGDLNVSTNIPIYFEIYRRGLLFSAPLDVYNNKFNYTLAINANFAPKFTIMIYSISSLGKLYESILVVHVNYTYSLSLSTDKEIYEPGDLMTLTITPSTNITSVLALSFIDSAVLDVEPEDDSELGYFTMNLYSAYIRSGSTWGSGFGAESYWWFGYGIPTGGIYNLPFEDSFPRWSDYYLFGVDNFGGSQGDLPSFDELIASFDIEIRKNISESANWMPRLIVSETTNITFKLPDNIGEWTIRAVCNNLFEASKKIVLGGDVETLQIKAFLPFFIEFDIHEPIIQDDILSVKGYVYNYIGTDVHATVAIDAPELIILNKEIQEIFIPNNFVSEVEFSVYCTEPYFQNITLLGATEVSGTIYSDAKQLTTYIKPNGIEVINRTIGFLNASDGSFLLNDTLDPLAIHHIETLALYTDLMDISIDSWQSLIGYPYGCIEQTISKTLPTALIYHYLNQTGQLTPSLKQEMTLMILKGLDRIYNFQHNDGGWGWWRDDASKILMTSIVISALNQIQEVGFQVNSISLRRGINYLIALQDISGVWDFQEYSSNVLEATAFILKGLMNSKNITTEMDLAINKAVNEFQTLWNTEDMKSSYGASLFYIGIVDSIYENTTFSNELIQYIKDNKRIDENMIYWDCDANNIWYWRKLGNIVEITSYAAWALALEDFIGNYAIIQKAIRYLLNERNRWGWGSTADTAAAITALTTIKTISNSEGFVDFNGTISIIINNNRPPQYELNYTKYSNLPSEILFTLSDLMTEKTNTINISLNGDGQICYIFESIQILRSNPKIEIPAIIEASKNEHFYIPIKFSEIDSRLPIVDTTISLLNVPQNLQDHETNYTITTPILTNGSEIYFSLIAPNIDGYYFMDGISILGFIQYTDSSKNSSNYQLLQRTVGPIEIRIGTQSQSLNPLIELNNGSITNESLTLVKQVSKQNFLIPGDVITVTLKISNDGDQRQFYVLEDHLPTGTIFLSDSVEIFGDYIESEISHDLFSSGVNFFFPMLATGITEVSYQFQVKDIKNSYAGLCKLWGMYDDFCISTNSVVFENIPRKYYTNDSIYQDLIQPIMFNLSIKENSNIPDKKLLINFHAIDNNAIDKVRIVFYQDSGWRAQTYYSMRNQVQYSINVNNIKNIDSTVKIYLEVTDNYGNILTTNLFTIRIHLFEVIPYIIIGVIIGFSIGLASIASMFYKKYEEKRNLRTDAKFDEIRKRSMKVSFLDESEEDSENK
ncbi:MAG: MG2 domain-containing protein [Candidatus Hermodarchaeota archaeon]